MLTVSGTGRLTADPEKKTTAQGTSVVSFSIAVPKNFKPKEGPDADFFNCTAWRNTADYIANYGHKGDIVEVSGTLEIKKWEKDGQKHSDANVVVDNARFWGGKSATTETAAQSVPAETTPVSPPGMW